MSIKLAGQNPVGRNCTQNHCTNMSNIVAQAQYNTRAQTFIAKRGALVMKEFSSIGKLVGEYKSKIEIDTLVFSYMQGTQSDRTFGLKVTVTTMDDGYAREGTCLIDQDELPELINGISYLEDKLALLIGGVANYTELAYVTKDSFSIGFYVNPGSSPDPKSFCSTESSDNAFMHPSKLPQPRECIQNGLDYLLTIGGES